MYFSLKAYTLAFQRALDHENRVRNVFLVTFLVSRCYFKKCLMPEMPEKIHRLTPTHSELLRGKIHFRLVQAFKGVQSSKKGENYRF